MKQSAKNDLRKPPTGPGHSQVSQRDNGKDLTSTRSDLIIMDDGLKPSDVEVTARMGITKAIQHPLRYVITRNKLVSRGKHGPRGDSRPGCPVEHSWSSLFRKNRRRGRVPDIRTAGQPRAGGGPRSMALQAQRCR